VIPQETTSNSSSSKLNHSVSHSKIPKRKSLTKLPTKATKGAAKASTPKNPKITLVKSKSDLNSLRTYPDSFTIVTSPKRSPSAGPHNKRRKNPEEDDDLVMEFEWVKPPPEKLYEAASLKEKFVEEPIYENGHFGPRVVDEPVYVPDHFGQRISVPTSPILTDKVMVGSSHR
jgi:hypothetical protein